VTDFIKFNWALRKVVLVD